MHSNYSTTLPSIPQDTARAAVSLFDEENLYIKIGNSLDAILKGLDSRPFERPLRQTSVPVYVLSLATVFQYQERLTDDEMAVMVRNRPEVRYGLRLSMRYPNISASNLCQYRQFLFDHPESFDVFEKIAKRVGGFSEVHVNGNSHTLPETICLNNRTHKIVTSMLETLETLAATNPRWMREIAPAHWYERYNRSYSRFVKEVLEKGTPEMIMEIGSDMRYVLNLAEQKEQIADLAEIKWLTQVFQENFEILHTSKQLGWKPIGCTYCSRKNLKKMEVK